MEIENPFGIEEEVLRYEFFRDGLRHGDEVTFHVSKGDIEDYGGTIEGLKKHGASELVQWLRVMTKCE